MKFQFKDLSPEHLGDPNENGTMTIKWILKK